MARTNIAHTDSRFTYAGSWATGTDTNAASGGYHYTSAVGDQVIFTVPASAGFTGFIPVGLRLYVPGTFTYTVDGGPPTTVSTSLGTTDATVPTVYQSTLAAIEKLDPTVAHRVALTNTGGNLYIDQMEAYTLEASVAGRLLIDGHSIALGVYANSTTDISTDAGTYRWGTVLAKLLGMTEMNFGVNGASLCDATPGIAATPYWQTMMLGGSPNNWDDRLGTLNVLMIGYNDIRSRDPTLYANGAQYYIARFISRIEDAVRRIRLRTGAPVIVPGIGWASTQMANLGWQQTDAVGHTYNLTYGWPTPQVGKSNAWDWNVALMSLVARNRNMVYVDTALDTAGFGGAAITGDGSHPSYIGHSVLARRIYDVYRGWQQHGGLVAA